MTSKNILTEDELKRSLLLLKNRLKGIELEPPKNILFFNLDSYYIYLDNQSSILLSNLIKSLEQYIPLLLCIDQKSCKLLISAAKSSNSKEINRIKNDFYKKSVFKFLNILKSSNSNEELNYIFNLCNNLRIMQN